MTRDDMIATIKLELERQAQSAEIVGPYVGDMFDFDGPTMTIDGDINIGTLADAIGVRAGYCTVRGTFDGSKAQTITWDHT